MVNVRTKTVQQLKKRPVLKGRLKSTQLRKLDSLLDMLYTPIEIASAIGFSKRQVYRVYLHMGCPSTKDDTGHIFIHGSAFRGWYKETYKKEKLNADEAYCLSCKYAVDLIDPIEMIRVCFISVETVPKVGENGQEFSTKPSERSFFQLI